MKTLIFGNAGSGKSTRARALGAEHGVTVLDLDEVVWQPDRPGTFRSDAEVIEALGAFLSANPSWVIEGCYGRWMEHLLPHCTEILFMNPGEEACLRHCLARPWEPNKYPSREAQDAWLPALFAWVRGYYTRTDGMSLAAHRRLFDTFNGAKRELTGDEPDVGPPATDGTATSLETARLWLLPGHPSHWVAMRQGATTFTGKFGLAVADGICEWVTPADQEELVAKVWDSFLILARSELAVIGTCACRKAPDEHGAVEIAYGIAPDYQGCGYATEAATALTAAVLRRDEVKLVYANTLSELNASTQVLTKSGFRKVGEFTHPEDGLIWRWARHR